MRARREGAIGAAARSRRAPRPAPICSPWDGWPLLVAFAFLQVLLGAAGGAIEPPLRAITLGFAAPGLHGVAASFLQLTQRLSATFFVALATGVVLGLGAGPSPLSLRLTIAICTGACLLALAVALHPAVRRPHHGPPESTDSTEPAEPAPGRKPCDARSG